MAYPLMEHLTGETFYYNGSVYKNTDSLAEELSRPSDLRTYYETLRIMDGVLLYAEDHMDRLAKSVRSLEDFPVDIDVILDSARCYVSDSGIKTGNIRIVLTNSQLLIHGVDIKLPTKEMFTGGINTSLLKWERQTPNVKVFRGDYKNTVISDGKVYSAPDSKILIGITRRRVIEALRRAGTELSEGMFTLEELKGEDCALFVSSTPFDILPVRYIDGYVFDSADNDLLQMISREYKAYTAEYIAAHK